MFGRILSSIFASLLLASCASLETVKEGTANVARGVKEFSWGGLGRPGVDVVDVREQELKEMPLGKERALAYERRRRNSFWSFALPDFEEPDLPDAGEVPEDGSLLPPKSL